MCCMLLDVDSHMICDPENPKEVIFAKLCPKPLRAKGLNFRVRLLIQRAAPDGGVV